MSRRVYLLGAGLTLVALALAFTDRALTQPVGPMEAKTKCIRPGMTLEEVETVIGKIEGTFALPDERSGRRLTDREGLKAFLNDPSRMKTGMSLARGEVGGVIAIHFREDGRVARAEWWPGGHPPEESGLLARLRAWLGW